jgi:hypothetical protein
VLLPAPPRIAGSREPSERSLIEKTRREALLDAYDALKIADPEISERRAARMLGEPLTSLWRLLRKRSANQTLVPQHHKAGRKLKHPELSALLEVEAIRAKLDTLYISTFGASSESAACGRRTGKVSVALQRFAEEPECPPALAARLMLGQQPKELVAYLRRITPEQEARIRGEKNFKLNGIVSRRDQTIRLPDGTRALNLSGYIVEFDDMSVNQPFYVELPDGKFMISRQGLYARDVKSGRWLGVELVARPREAYRAEDILRFVRKLMFIYGKFSVLRLERGIWAARSLKGYKVTETGAVEEEFDRPEMDRAEQAKLQDGLAGIGVQIQYVTSAHRKGALESSFNYLQTIIATYTTEFNNAGRYAGEFELVAKRVRQVRAESHHPAALRFAPIDTLADRIERAMDFVNRRPRRGNVQDNAYAEWECDQASRPLPPITELDLAAFLPEMRERHIDHGRIVTTVDGVTHDFRADIFAELGHGYRVFLKFDPSEPTLGAAIYNRETSSANHLMLKQGEFICFARWEMPGPQLEAATADGLTVVTTEQLYGVGPDRDEGYGNRQRQDKYVRTAFRGLPKPGQPSIKVAEVRDGHGNFARVTQDAGSAAAAPQPQLPAPKSSRQAERDEDARLDQIAAEALSQMRD